MSALYPIPRQTRQAILTATAGQTTFGPFDFPIFEQEDVEVLVRAPDVETWTSLSGEDFTVTPVTTLPGRFSVTLDAGRSAGDVVWVKGSRLHRRETNVTLGGAIKSVELEKELDKQSTVLQELRRDLDAVQGGDIPALALASAVLNNSSAPGGSVADALEGLDARATASEGDIADLQSDVGNLRGAIANLPTRASVQSTLFPNGTQFLRIAGYWQAGDGGGALYKRVNAQPAHAGKIQSADGAWWEYAETAAIAAAFGVRADVWDDPAAIAANTAGLQGCIDYLPALGGTIILPPGRIDHGALTIGNGTTIAISTRTGVKLIGGGGAGIYGVRGTYLYYAGDVGGTQIKVKGPIECVTIEGVTLNGGGKANICLDTEAIRFSRIRDLFIADFLETGWKLYGTAHADGKNIMLDISGVYITSLRDNTIGWDLDGVLLASTDTWLSTITTIRVDMHGENSIGVKIGFSDNIVIIQLHAIAVAASSVGIEFNALTAGTDGNNFPLGHQIIGGSITRIRVVEDGAHKIGPVQFIGFGITDIEEVPIHPMLRGFDRWGRVFNNGISGVSELAHNAAVKHVGTAIFNTLDTSGSQAQATMQADATNGLVSFYAATNHPTYLGAGGDPLNGLKVGIDGKIEAFQDVTLDKKLLLKGSASGTGSLAAPAAASSYAWVMPAAAGTVVLNDNTATITNKSIDASQLTGTVAAARLPTPGASTLGGVKSLAAVATKYLTSIGTDGTPAAAQPSVSDLSEGSSGSGAVARVGGPTFTAPINLQQVNFADGASLTATYQSSTGYVFNNYANGPISFYRNSVLQMQIDTSGNVAPSVALKLPSYTVATLPTGAAGRTVFASDLRVFNGTGTQEGASAGTGGAVTHNGTAWKIAGTNVTAVA